MSGRDARIVVTVEELLGAGEIVVEEAAVWKCSARGVEEPVDFGVGQGAPTRE